MRHKQLRHRYQPFSLLFVYAWIVGIFALGSSPLVHLWRPLIIALAVVVLITVAAYVIGRTSIRVQVAAGLVAMTLVAAWPFVAGVLVVLIWRYCVGVLRYEQDRPVLRESASSHVVRLANGFGLVIAAVATANVVLTGGLSISTAPPIADRPLPVSGAPNIHLLLLDAYPRADTLRTMFEYENAPFISDLEQMGFQVVEHSRSNYTKTIMTVASMLNMDYIESIPELERPDDSAVVQDRQLTRAINDARAPELLRRHGYEIIASGAAFGETSLMSADRFMEAGGLTKFEEQITRFTWLASVLDVIAPDLLPDQHRQSVQRSFDNWLGITESPRDRPFFMLTHVLAPHSPFLFESDGTKRPASECFPASCPLWDESLPAGMTRSEYADGVRAQMDYVNELVRSTVERVREADPGGVIVIFSDHGLRFDGQELDEFFRNFIAVATPGVDEPLPQDSSPVNLLPHLFNAYLRTDLPIRPYEGWLSSEKPRDVTRFEPRSQ